MQWYALLPLVALASALTQPEQQDHNQYYGNHRRPCGEAQFSVITADAENFTLRTTGIPPHNAFRTSPYRAAIQDLVYTFPREPVALDHPLCVPAGVPIGFALDGAPFYNPLSRDWNNAVEGSCAQVYDRCGGNVDRNNQYYYSGVPNFDQSCLDLNRAQESVHIGTALDGFPIYFERRFNGSLLDECGGRYLDTTNKRFYRYVVSENFPYTIGCFRGRVHNISTLTYCKGHEGEYGSLCACVNVGPPGMAVGYKWLSKDAVTVGQCMRRPVVGERERALICNRDAIPAPDFLEEDRRSSSCVDFRALYSLIVIQGHRGGLAPWTRLWNYGKEEDMEEREEDSEYIRHFKALRWLLSDLDVLNYPALQKYEDMKNKTKPLSVKEQRRLRNALAQIWVVAFLREAHKLRPDASDYEKEEGDRAFMRLMYVLKTLKAMELTAFVKKPEGKPMDPWGIWIADDEENDDDEEMKRDEDKLGALISQLTALQTLGQMKERERKDEKSSEGEDRNKEIRARLLHLLWEIQNLSGEGRDEERGGMGRGEEDGEEHEEGGMGSRGRNGGYQGMQGEGEGSRMGEGGSRREGREGGRCPCEERVGRDGTRQGGDRAPDANGQGEGPRGDRPEPTGGRGGCGQGDQGRQGGDGQGRDDGYGPPRDDGYGPPMGGRDGPPRDDGYGPPRGGRDGPPRDDGYGPPRGGRDGPPRDDRYGPPMGGRDGPPRDDRYGPPRDDGYGPPRGGRDGPPRGDGYGPPRGGRDGPPRDDGYGPPRGGRDGPPRDDGYGPPRGGRDGPPRDDGYGPPRGGRDGPPRDDGYGPPRGGRDGPPRDDGYGPPRGGRDGPPRDDRYGPPMGGRDGPPSGGREQPPPRRDGGDSQCPDGGGQNQDRRDMMEDMMDMLGGGRMGSRDELQHNLGQILRLISYLRGPRDGGSEMPGMGDRRDGGAGRDGRNGPERRPGY